MESGRFVEKVVWRISGSPWLASELLFLLRVLVRWRQYLTILSILLFLKDLMPTSGGAFRAGVVAWNTHLTARSYLKRNGLGSPEIRFIRDRCECVNIASSLNV
ncbi:hypothetical protein BLAT2472_40647 [Burkholderia latens]